MSAGRFEDVAYETDAGELFPARVQPETLAMTIAGTPNSPAAGPIPSGRPTIRMRAGKRDFGIIPRSVTLKLPNGGTPPPGYTGDNLVVPVLTASLFAGAAKNATVVYLGATWRIASKSSEIVR